VARLAQFSRALDRTEDLGAGEDICDVVLIASEPFNAIVGRVPLAGSSLHAYLGLRTVKAMSWDHLTGRCAPRA
jgi:hypothetical protein